MAVQQAGNAPEFSAAEYSAMLHAGELAQRSSGRTSPNPLVGAVLLDATGDVIGEGWHERAGEPHAEVVALRAGGARARGGTMVVTLEPCAHTGRTGPCVDALLAAGISRVVIGVVDPDPIAAGGARVLRNAGVDVSVGVAEREMRWGNRAWLAAVSRGRPYLTWKFAATLDGRSAAADGSSRWITGPTARADVHLLRSRHDAVMVGVGTVLADDPELTVRLDSYSGPQPLRVVLDSVGASTERRSEDTYARCGSSSQPSTARRDRRHQMRAHHRVVGLVDVPADRAHVGHSTGRRRVGVGEAVSRAVGPQTPSPGGVRRRAARPQRRLPELAVQAHPLGLDAVGDELVRDARRHLDDRLRRASSSSTNDQGGEYAAGSKTRPPGPRRAGSANTMS